MFYDVSQNVKLYKYPIRGKIVYWINRVILGAHIPRNVEIGKNVIFAHNSVGTVVHPKTRIGDNVMIFQNVTIGKQDVLEDWTHSKVEGFIIGEGAVLCAGAKVLCKAGTLRVGRKSIIAANAVLLQSTEPYEVWGGVPARLLGYNEHGLQEDGFCLVAGKVEKKDA